MARQPATRDKAIAADRPLAPAPDRLAVGRLAIKEARFGALDVDELTVRGLRILERDPRA